ncbi:MAG TPA: ribonuclease PH [Elusimicrobia bacterium]|nr:ribonuclease PH [Elusimicrobiota bacterium]
MRIDDRKYDEIRKIKIIRNYQKFADASCLIQCGNTKVLCAATIQNSVPNHLKDSGTGWVSSEYAFLPRAGTQRNSRQRSISAGRTQEIQRLIGRSLRSIVDLSLLGERSILIDCDVIQADGGTRTTSINGAFITLHDALNKMRNEGYIDRIPIKNYIGAISVGIYNGEILLDLCASEDNKASVDMNVVMTDTGRFVEIQGTGEEATFSQKDLERMLKLAKKGISEIIEIQKNVIKK